MSKILFMKIIGVLFLISSFFCTPALGLPSRIGYIGLLNDSNGQPLNGTIPIKFLIYNKTTEDGIVLWEETLTNVAVRLGFCKVQLGSQIPLDTALFSDNTELYLEVRTLTGQGDWEIIEPRTLIAAAPFAMEAAHAEMAANIDNGSIEKDLSVGGALGVKGNLSVAGVIIPGTGGIKFPDGSTLAAAGSAYADVDSLKERIAALESRVYNLQTLLKNVTALLENVTRDGPNLYFTGVNVHIRNGAGQTMTVNGLGNLIVGYNEESDTGSQRGGSHNLVVGDRHSYTSFGGFVAGRQNTISDSFASVSGGYGNTASGDFSSVSGGDHNIASGASSSISGGGDNEASALASSVTGGRHNKASGEYAIVAGGGYHEAELGNEAHSRFSAILGGAGNIAGDKNSEPFDYAEHATIVGGRGNQSKGEFATVTGGAENEANGKFASTIGGRSNSAEGEYAGVSGGTENNATGKYSSVSGGYKNHARAIVSSISGGSENIVEVNGKGGNISGGSLNKVMGWNSSVSGGFVNKTEGLGSSVVAGYGNTAEGDFSCVSGGISNKTVGQGSSVSEGANMTDTTSYPFLVFQPMWPE